MLASYIFPVLLAAGCVSAAPGLVEKRDTWGGALSLGPTKSHIISATTTLIPGTAPMKQNGMLFLWPGMSNGTGDLVQTTLESWPDNSWCGGKAGEWCVRASLFGGFGQLDGPASVVKGTDKVKIEYTKATDSDTWTQMVTNADTGAQLSTFSRLSGPMTGWGTGTECNGGCTGTASEQVYMNTKITLAAADPTFIKTVGVSQGTKYTNMKMSSDNKVLTIERINVPKMG